MQPKRFMSPFCCLKGAAVLVDERKSTSIWMKCTVNKYGRIFNRNGRIAIRPRRYVFLIVFFGLLININLVKAIENNLLGEISVVEMMPNPEGTDTKDNEYLKLKNNSDQTVDLTGWKVCNISGDCYNLKGEIASNGCLIVKRLEFIFTLHNDKEQIKLFNPVGSLADEVNTDAANSGQAWLCYEGSCSWGLPRETCDYTDLIIVKEESLNEVTANSENMNTNQTVSEESDNNFPEGKTLVVNKNNNSPEKTPTINSKEDWAKVKVRMKEKNLLSLTVNLQGKIVAPYNIVKEGLLYLQVFDELVAVNFYASRRSEFSTLSALYKKNTIVTINNGFLKNFQSNWQIGIGKGSDLVIQQESGKQKAKNVSSFLKANEIDWSDPAKYEGRKIQIEGRILKKSGNYFFLENQNQPAYPITVYTSSFIWNQYLNREKISAFPSFTQSTAETNDYKGRNLKAVGNIEISGKSYRILITNPQDLTIETVGQKIDSQLSDNKIKEKKDNVSLEKTNNSDNLTKNFSVEGYNSLGNQNSKSQNQLADSQKNILVEAKKILWREKLTEKMSWSFLASSLFQKMEQKITKIISFIV